MKKIVVVLLASVVGLSCSRSKSKPENESSSEKEQATLIEMSLEAQKHVGLEVAPAEVHQLNEKLQVVGTVQPIDSRIAHVRPLASGRVQSVLTKVGDRVRAGQPLATFDNIEAGELVSQYQAARADLERLKVQQAVAAKQAERNRRLADIGAVPQKEHEISQAEQHALQEAIKAQESVLDGLRARLRRFGVDESKPNSSSITSIRSPFTGVVIEAAAAPGEVVDQGSELFRVADVSRLWVQAEVYEKDLARIRLGQSALVSVDTYPDEKFDAKVTYIGDILDPQTRTAKVRCEVPNLEYRLKLDMFASVSLPTTVNRKALAVPVGAIQQLEKRNVVFVRRADTKFEPREVKLGTEVEGRTEVVSGLKEGEQVVVNGSFHLKSILLSEELGEGEE